MLIPIGAYMRVDISDETDPGFEFHGEHGMIIDSIENPGILGSEWRYRMVVDTSGVTLEVESWDLRPPLQVPSR